MIGLEETGLNILIQKGYRILELEISIVKFKSLR